MDREECHQNHLDRLTNPEVMENPEQVEDQKVTEDLETQETRMGTRGDQNHREVLIPLRLSTRPAGSRHLRHNQDKLNIEVCGMFWRTRC